MGRIYQQGCGVAIMADVFTKAKRSEVLETRSAEFGVPSDRSGSEFPEIELVARDAEVFDNVRNDAARHIARMPSESDQAVGTKRIRVMPVTARGAEKFTTDFAESPLQLAAVPRGEFGHGSGGENKFVAESRRNGASGFEQRFQVSFGGLLKAKRGFAAVTPVRVAAGQQAGLGYPDAVLIPPDLHFREWNDHNATTVTRRASGVKRAFDV
jgi:hypothetical protein